MKISETIFQDRIQSDMQEVIKSLCKGNEKAFKIFFYQHKDAVYKYAILHLRDSDIAEDVVQEVFIRFWNRISQINPDQNVRSYLYTIARNVVFDELRKNIQFQDFSSYTLHTGTIGVNDSEDDINYKELENLYQQAIGLLPEQRQKIYRLSKLEYLSHDEIASLLNISKNTVRDQLVKGKKFIREYVVRQSSVIPFALLFIKLL